MSSDYFYTRRPHPDGEEIIRNCSNCGWCGFQESVWCPTCQHSLGARMVQVIRCNHDQPGGCRLCDFITRQRRKRYVIDGE